MRVAVTGSNGQVGSRLVDLLLARGHAVLGLSRGPKRTASAHEYASVELTAENAVVSAITAFKPDSVINPASMTDVDGCEKNKDLAFAINVLSSAYVSKAAAQSGAHLIHVSTDYVFDGEKGGYTEDDVPNPRGTYALTKYLGEGAARVWSPGCAIARTAVVFGWPPAGRPNFGSWIVTALSEGKPVKLFEDQFVSPSLADSVAAMLLEISERKLSGIYNTVGADIVDRVTFGRAVCEQFGFDPKLITPTKMKDANLPSPRPMKSGLSVDKVRRELQTKPLSLSDALKKLHKDWQEKRS